jgi:hypothetical protein
MCEIAYRPNDADGDKGYRDYGDYIIEQLAGYDGKPFKFLYPSEDLL